MCVRARVQGSHKKRLFIVISRTKFIYAHYNGCFPTLDLGLTFVMEVWLANALGGETIFSKVFCFELSSPAP